MKTQKLYITVGIPGSGKSTYSKKFVESSDIEIKYLSSDILRKKFGTGEEDQSVTPLVFSHIKTKTKQYLSNKKSVLIDSTAITPKNRKDFIDIGKQYPDVEIIALVFQISLSIAKQRNNSRERVVPEYVIDKMYKQFKFPSKSEGFDLIQKI